MKLAGEHNPQLIVSDVSKINQGDYTVSVSNRGGIVESGIAELTVVLPVKITIDFDDLTVLEGAIARFSVEASGTGPLEYQWYYGGNPIAGAIGPSHEIGIVNEGDRGLYMVEIRNEISRVRSR